MVEPLRFYPPYTNGLVVHAAFLEKSVFLLSGQGGLPYTLSGPTTKKKHFFMCEFPKQEASYGKKVGFIAARRTGRIRGG